MCPAGRVGLVRLVGRVGDGTDWIALTGRWGAAVRRVGRVGMAHLDALICVISYLPTCLAAYLTTCLPTCVPALPVLPAQVHAKRGFLGRAGVSAAGGCAGRLRYQSITMAIGASTIEISCEVDSASI